MLSAIPPVRRRRAAWVLAAMAALLAAVAVLAWTRDVPGLVRAAGVVAGLVALLTAGIGWGLGHSVTLDAQAEAEARLDAVLHAAGGGCACGHDHDLTEMHVTDADPVGASEATDADCAPDAAGCTHSCGSCLLASRALSEP